MRNLLFLSVFSILISACGSDYLYEEEHILPEEGWTYADTVDFRFSIGDTLALYNLYLEVEHSPDYSYQNLYTKISTLFPSGERRSQVISLELADKAGAWQGDCRGEKCRFLAPIQENAFFNKPGTYVFTLEQYMRQSPEAGLKKIGFKLEDTGNSR